MLFNNVKQEFPTLNNNSELVYLDSAASTQTHQRVLDKMSEYYEYKRCNVNRGDFRISQEVSADIEEARCSVAKLINAKSEQIMFTAGATEGLNIIAEWYKDVPTVIITEAEHTANILPWIAQGRTIDNGRLVVLPITERGTVDTNKACEMFSQYPNGVLSINSHSNVTGICTNYSKLTKAAQEQGIKVIIDGCQTLGTHKFDVGTVDHAVFSGHKMYGPTGIGFMYSRLPLEKMRAVRLGGGSVTHYDFNGNVNFYDGPSKHEVGTPNIAGILGLGVAAEWLMYIGYQDMEKHFTNIDFAMSDTEIFNIKGLKLIYPSYRQNGRYVYSFTCEGYHPSDVSALVGFDNIALRVGKLCAHPIVNKVSGGKGVLRVSPGIYNTTEDMQKLSDSLCKAIQKLS
ncbi:aminotransferase class V-fold PLP-dependent enzyme [bacterium]|jgi:selenocysteine lyase/cysteine desulfurase|nr:aminotransferase class V-fold PLP-dependent enzyme [bacterium]